MLFTEQLLHKNQKYILSGKYQNSLYNGVPLYQFFNQKQQSQKEGLPFNELISTLLHNAIPYVPLLQIIPNLTCFQSHQDMYIENSGRYAKIKHVINYINNCSEKIILNVRTPSFFARRYLLQIYNIKDKTTEELFLRPEEFKNNPYVQEYCRCFHHIPAEEIDEAFQGQTLSDYMNLYEKVIELWRGQKADRLNKA